MRRDLMEAVLSASKTALFAEAEWSERPGEVVKVFEGGGDVEFEMFGDVARRATVWFRVVKADFPGIAAQQTLTLGGAVYTILEKRTPQDAPLEWELAASGG